MILKIAVIVVFIFEIFHSHQSGRKSGMESRWLAERTGVQESLLRSAAHVLLFAVLTALGSIAFGWVGFIAALVWAAADEASKPLLRNQRHCSGKDILLNLAGVGIGGIVTLLIK